MKTKEIDVSNEWNAAIVACLKILNQHSKSGGNFWTTHYTLIDDKAIEPIRNKIKSLVK